MNLEIETIWQSQSDQRYGLSHDDRQFGGTLIDNLEDSILGACFVQEIIEVYIGSQNLTEYA